MPLISYLTFFFLNHALLFGATGANGRRVDRQGVEDLVTDLRWLSDDREKKTGHTSYFDKHWRTADASFLSDPSCSCRLKC